MSADSQTRPSEAAQLAVQLVPSLHEDVVRELRTLLTHELGVPSAAAGRWAQLRLLVHMVREEHGEVPSVADYEQARERELAAGRSAPAASTLCEAYGRWHSAVSVAVRLAFQGTASRAMSTHKGLGRSQPYTPREVLNAVRRCHRFHDAWPTEWEYGEWAQLDRKLARQRGEVPRTPGLKEVRGLFNDFSVALDEARALGG